MSHRFIALVVVLIVGLAAWMLLPGEPDTSPPGATASRTAHGGVSQLDGKEAVAIAALERRWTRLQAQLAPETRWKTITDLDAEEITFVNGEPWFRVRLPQHESPEGLEASRTVTAEMISRKIRMLPLGVQLLAVEPGGATWFKINYPNLPQRFDGREWTSLPDLPAIETDRPGPSWRGRVRFDVRAVWSDRDGNIFFVGSDMSRRKQAVVIRRTPAGETIYYDIPLSERDHANDPVRFWQQPNGAVAIGGEVFDHVDESHNPVRQWKRIYFHNGQFGFHTLSPFSNDRPYAVLPDGAIVFEQSRTPLRLPPVGVDERPLIREIAWRMSDPDPRVRDEAMFDLIFMLGPSRKSGIEFLLKELGNVPEIRSRLERIRDARENEDKAFLQQMAYIDGRIASTPLTLLGVGHDSTLYFSARAAQEVGVRRTIAPALITMDAHRKWRLLPSMENLQTFLKATSNVHVVSISPYAAPDNSVWPAFGFQIHPGGEGMSILLPPGAPGTPFPVTGIDNEGRIWSLQGSSVKLIDLRHPPAKPLLPYKQVAINIIRSGGRQGIPAGVPVDENVKGAPPRVVRVGLDEGGVTELPYPWHEDEQLYMIHVLDTTVAVIGSRSGFRFHDGQQWRAVNGFKDYVDQNASVIAAELSRVHVFTNSMDGFAQIVIADERGGLWHYAGRRQERDLREGSTLLNSVPTADERKDLLERTQLRHFDGKTWHTATLPLEPQDVGVFTYRPIRSANGIMLDVLRVGPDERSEQIHRTLLVRWQPDSGFTFTPLEPEQAARLAEAERITLADGSVFPAYTGKASILENFEAGHLVLQLRQNDKVLAEKALPGVNQGRVIDKADETFWLATLDGVQPIVVTEDAGMYRIELGALSPWGYPLMPTRSAFVDTVGWLWTEESAERYARMKLPDAPPLPTSLLQGAR